MQWLAGWGIKRVMCGRFNVMDSPQVRELLDFLGVAHYPLRFSGDVAPGSIISIIHEPGGQRRISDAIWWLCLDRRTLKPDYRYASFNSRSDKLNTPRALACKPYRESRCIIPASAFIEGLGDRKTYHRIELQNSAIAFGGVYREYLNPETGESVYAASIITLPPLPQWQHIHPKSLPLMLPLDQPHIVDAWLSQQVQDVAQFAHLLEPVLRGTQLITPIGRPSKWDAIGDSFSLSTVETERSTS